MRVGIIGLGKMGRIRADQLRACPGAEIALVYDVDPELAAQFPEARLCGSPEDVCNGDVDAVFVCTPNGFTASYVIAALDAGKHVFAEKPPGRSVAEVERMVEAERRAGDRVLKFGFNHRYHAGIQESKRIIDSGTLGRVLWIRGVYGKGDNAGFENSWRSSREIVGGGILLDQGIHMLDLFRLFCDDFVEVKSMVGSSFYGLDLEDNAFALLRDSRGRIAMLHSSSTQWKHKFSLEVFTSEGYVAVNGILSSTRSYGDETITVGRRATRSATGKPREELIYFDTDPSWKLEVEEFVDCVRTGSPVRHGSSADALEAMKLVEAIYRGDPSWHDVHFASGSDAATGPEAVLHGVSERGNEHR